MPDKIYATPQNQIDVLEAAIAGVLCKLVAAPTAATDPGEPGQFAVDSSYLYVCIASGNWVVFAADAWPV